MSDDLFSTNGHAPSQTHLVTAPAVMMPKYPIELVDRLPIEARLALQWKRSIFPVSLDKTPMVDTWKPYQARYPTAEEFERWLKMSPPAWALVTGALSRVFVLDFDGEKGQRWLDTWGLHAHVRSGSGGSHVYGEHPGWPVRTMNAKSAKWLAEHYPGVDVRGDGGYIVFCGRNTSGAYKWLRGPTEDGLKTILLKLPEDLATFLGLAAPPATEETDGDQLGAEVDSNLAADTPAPAPAELPKRESTIITLQPATNGDVTSRVLAYGLKLLASGIGRDNSAFLMAVQARDNGLSQSEAEGLGATFLARCGDTNTKGQLERFDDNEFRKKVASAYSRPARQPWADDEVVGDQATELATEVETKAETLNATFIWDVYHRDEFGDATLLARLYHDRLLYDSDEKAWYIFGPHHWRKDATNLARRAIPSTVASVYLRLAAAITAEAEAEADTDTAKQKRAMVDSLTKRAKQLRGLVRANHVLSFAQDIMGKTGLMWDKEPMLLAVQNGVIDLATGDLRPGRPADMLRTVAPVTWQGLEASAPRWEQFIKEIMAEDDAGAPTERSDFLRRWFGYCITGEVKEHKLPVWCGPDGRNGKDTCVETLGFILGDLATATSTDVLLAKRRDDSATASPYLADLQGRRLVWASETNESAKMHAEQVKRLTGRNTINARWLHANPIKFEPTHKVMLITNRKPAAPADDNALWSRVLVVEFTRRFVDKPTKPNERPCDKNLLNTLKAEAPGILAWLVRGCLEWQALGLQPPRAIELATEAYRAGEDDLGLFIKEFCVEQPDARAKSGDMLKAFNAWRGANLSSKEFGKLIGDRFDKVRLSSGWHYLGIGLIDDTKRPDNEQ